MTVFLSCLLSFMRLRTEDVGKRWRRGRGGDVIRGWLQEGCAKPFVSIRQAINVTAVYFEIDFSRQMFLIRCREHSCEIEGI